MQKLGKMRRSVDLVLATTCRAAHSVVGDSLPAGPWLVVIGSTSDRGCMRRDIDGKVLGGRNGDMFVEVVFV